MWLNTTWTRSRTYIYVGTYTSSSALDLILNSINMSIGFSSVLGVTHINDRCFIFATLKVRKPRVRHRFILRRDLQNIGAWWRILRWYWMSQLELCICSSYVDSKVAMFSSTSTQLYDEFAPVHKWSTASWLIHSEYRSVVMASQSSTC